MCEVFCQSTFDLRGKVKSLTGGRASLQMRDAKPASRTFWRGRPGEMPGPTVTVRMGEGRIAGARPLKAVRCCVLLCAAPGR